MKYTYLLLIFFLCSATVFGQGEAIADKGVVSYVSSQHVYVKFASTGNIAIGDTLFMRKEDGFRPCLLVENKSSISCVCSVLMAEKINVSDEIYILQKVIEEEEVEAEPPGVVVPASKPVSTAKEKPAVGSPDEEALKQDIRGRLSVGSYSNFSGKRTSHRMRYTLSFQGNNLRNSRFSVNSYLSFRHTINEWSEVKDNLARALKVYSLAAGYDFNKTTSLRLGREINPRISSMGAIDGVQFEKGMGDFLVGVIAGSRPDYLDYTFNPNLFQAGAYIGRVSNRNNNYQQQTLAFIEQRNHGKIDRRFVYLQHSSTPVKNLSVFGSMELDLYKNLNNEVDHSLSLTNLFVNVRYRFSKLLSSSLSYDNRKNVIYYESFKNYIDSLIENETRQGLRLNVICRPFKHVSWGLGTSWRFQKSEMNISRNINTYINFSKIPKLNISASLTANILETAYLESKMFGLRVYKEIIEGKFNGDLYFRMVDYKYKTYEYNLRQYISGINFNIRLTRKLGLYFYYEGIFNDRNEMYNRFNTKIIQRF